VNYTSFVSRPRSRSGPRDGSLTGMPTSKNPAACLVTGANRGIGLAFARALAARGGRVIATARHPEKARDLAGLPLRLLDHLGKEVPW